MEKLWNTCLVTLERLLSEPNYQIFINSASPVSFSDNVFLIQVDNPFSKGWIQDKCIPLLRTEFQGTEFEQCVFEFLISEDSSPIPQDEAKTLFDPPPVQATRSEVPSGINPEFNFDAFIVGNNNRFAHAAAFAVSENPAKAYNPLFIYGSVGLGKTHLLHAIAEHISRHHPHLRASLITSEKFTNDLISSLKNKTTKAFKDQYRSVDVLLIDDIQFLAGKETTQEEFFHTFNELHQSNKQIVITSDRPPKDIPTLQDRLRTRFAWGLIADIQPPELETRIAILSKKIDSSPLTISDEVLHYIATQIPSNVRELEGALNRIVAYSSLLGSEVTLSIASNVIKDIIGTKLERPLTITLIKRKVADYFDLDYDTLSSKVRTKEVSYARQLSMYLARELTNTSLPKIGENFGNRDHSTVMHACDKIRSLIKTDPDTRNIVNVLISNVKNDAPSERYVENSVENL